jgi:hypothetical protein
MKIIITAQEALDKGIWPQVAEIAGYCISAISEGLDTNTQIDLTADQAEYVGLIGPVI